MINSNSGARCLVINNSFEPLNLPKRSLLIISTSAIKMMKVLSPRLIAVTVATISLHEITRTSVDRRRRLILHVGDLSACFKVQEGGLLSFPPVMELLQRL